MSSSPAPLRFPIAGSFVPLALRNLPVQAVYTQEEFWGQEIADGTQSGGLSPKRCIVSVHRLVDPEPVENVSVENDKPDMVEASEWRFWECERDDAVFGPLDAMITRGWGDKRQVAIPKDWAMRPGPDQGLYAKRRAAVSKGLKEKHAARKRNPQYGFDLEVVRAKGEL